MNESSVKNYKSFTIYEVEGEEKGIYFRGPIQNISFDSYYGESKFNAWQYVSNLKNPIRRLFETLIGNRNIVKNGEKWLQEDDCAGFNANILCFPIYFGYVTTYS